MKQRYQHGYITLLVIVLLLVINALPASGATAVTQSPAWSALPHQGLDNTVWSLAYNQGVLYAGGEFFYSGDIQVSGLVRAARLSGQNWSSLSYGGLNGPVYAMAVIGDDVYLAGYFSGTIDTQLELHNIVRFNPINGGLFFDLPGHGLSDTVWSLAVSGTDLYVGGWFTRTADASVRNMNGVAKFDTLTQQWSALSNQGLSPFLVQTLAVNGNILYVGGSFSQTHDGAVKDLNSIAMYDMTLRSWSGFPNGGLDGSVTALGFNVGTLYVGGDFNKTHDSEVTGLSQIAGYNANAGWFPFAHGGLNGFVSCFAFKGSDIYIGGNFNETYDHAVPGVKFIAKYTGSGWEALPNQGLNSTVRSMIIVGNDLYVGGHFWGISDNTVPGVNHIARLSLPPQLIFLPFIKKE